MSATEPEVIQPEKPNGKKSKAIAKREVVALDAVPEKISMEEVLLRAVEKDASIETIERLAALYERAQEKVARKEFFDALAAFQAECPIIKKTRTVKNEQGYRMYDYAPLDQIIKQTAGLIGKHGFAYQIKPRFEEATDKYPFGRIVAVCHVSHSGGHTEDSEFPIAIKEATKFTNMAQQGGTALTYAKRYAFTGAFGIVTEDSDEDGRMTPQQARETKREVRQPQMTPTAQKAANGSKERVQLEPAGEGEEAIDANTVTGLTKAMEKAALGQGDFLKRFPKLNGLEQVKFKDARVVMSWIADPTKN